MNVSLHPISCVHKKSKAKDPKFLSQALIWTEEPVTLSGERAYFLEHTDQEPWSCLTPAISKQEPWP